MICRRLQLTLFAWLALAAASAAHAGGTPLGGGQPLEVSLGRIVAALVICVIIAFLAILLVRQRSGRIDLRAFLGRLELKVPQVQVVETRRISQHGDVCLLRHAGREYLVLLVAGNVRLLHEGPEGSSGHVPGEPEPCE